ncbi:hypothetical protein LAZ67_5004401 [Cordylochernes scorpioides]|uniref:Reverse transcriptase domain-containing protein n=1 Tax=Cordylochernes scorpioides TaxID=51811 RepID=A0ABY6KJ45_9ARAC|nr:hypothetical protein LAZ67_5004401 [Cordylochernes scorpioides]
MDSDKEPDFFRDGIRQLPEREEKVVLTFLNPLIDRQEGMDKILVDKDFCAPKLEIEKKLLPGVFQLNTDTRECVVVKSVGFTTFTGVCQPTRIDWLPVLAHISPPELRRKEATKKMYQKLLDSPDLEINPILQSPPKHKLKSRNPIWSRGNQLLSQNFNISEAWTNSWISSDIPNKNLITCPSVKIPGFSLPRREWVLLNRFRTGQGRCAELMKLWGYTKDPNCACNVPQSMSHILDDCPLYKFNGGISNLHSCHPGSPELAEGLASQTLMTEKSSLLFSRFDSFCLLSYCKDKPTRVMVEDDVDDVLVPPHYVQSVAEVDGLWQLGPAKLPHPGMAGKAVVPSRREVLTLWGQSSYVGRIHLREEQPELLGWPEKEGVYVYIDEGIFFRQQGLEHTNLPSVNLPEFGDIHLLLYADDIAIIGESRMNLQKKIKILKEYLDENLMTLNESKSKIMVFRNGGKPSNKDRWFWNDKPITITSRYTYLGFPLTPTITTTHPANYFKGKALTAINATHPILIKSKAKSINLSTKLFDTIVRAVLMYAAPLWATEHKDLLDSIQDIFIRRFLNLPRYTPGYLIRLETGRISLSVTALKLTLKYWLRVLNMSSDRLPRICFNRTRELSNASGTPIGFIKKLNNLLNNNGSPALVSCDDPETLRSAITGLLKTAADQSIQNDLTRMDKSKLYSHYKDIHISFMMEGYLLGDFPFPVVRLLAQVRILSSFFRENHTKMLCGEDPTCTFCNSKLKNEITHYIFDCPALKEEPLCSKLGNYVLHFHQ